MMPLRTFMDAAGKPEHGPNEWGVVAGFLGDTRQWDAFRKSWSDLLDRHQIPYLQMSRLHARKKPFAESKWTDGEYMARFLSEAGLIVRSHVRMWAVDAVKNDDFARAKDEYPGLANYTNAYGLCGTAVALRLQMQHIWNEFPDRIAIEHYFEQGDKGIGNIDRVFTRCGMVPPVVRPGKPLASDPDKPYCVEFQAADWLAFESRKMARACFPKKPVIRPSLKALLKGVPGEAKVWTYQDLLKFCEIKRRKGEMQ